MKKDIFKAVRNCNLLDSFRRGVNRSHVIDKKILAILKYYLEDNSIEDIEKALNLKFTDDEKDKITNFNELSDCSCFWGDENGYDCSICNLYNKIKAPKFHSIEQNTTDTTQIPELDLANIPIPSLSKLIENHAESVNGPIEFVMLSVLSTLASAIGLNYSLQLTDTWQVFSPLMCVAVGDPSSKKSPAINAILKHLHEIESETNHDISCSNTTVEVLCRTLVKNPNSSMLISCDELIGWINSIGEYKGGSNSDRQFYLSAYNCDKYRCLRKSSNNFTIPRTHISVLGGIQPDILHKKYKELNNGDGLFERLILVTHSEKNTSRYFKLSNVKLDTTIVNQFKSVLRNLINNRSERKYKLTNEAFKVFENFNKELGKLSEKKNKYKSLFGKSASLASKLALIFQVYKDTLEYNSDNTFIDENILQSAINLSKYFIRQFIYITENICEESECSYDVTERAYQKLLKKAEYVSKGISPSYIVQYKIEGIQSAQVAASLLDELCARGNAIKVKKKYYILI